MGTADKNSHSPFRTISRKLWVTIFPTLLRRLRPLWNVTVLVNNRVVELLLKRCFIFSHSSCITTLCFGLVHKPKSSPFLCLFHTAVALLHAEAPGKIVELHLTFGRKSQRFKKAVKWLSSKVHFLSYLNQNLLGHPVDHSDYFSDYFGESNYI